MDHLKITLARLRHALNIVEDCLFRLQDKPEDHPSVTLAQAEQAEQAEQHYTADKWQKQVEEFLQARTADETQPTRVTVAEILRHLRIDQPSQTEMNRVARILCCLGWAKHRMGGRESRGYCYSPLYGEMRPLANVLACMRCGHKWSPRSASRPGICPSCHAASWDQAAPSGRFLAEHPPQCPSCQLPLMRMSSGRRQSWACGRPGCAQLPIAQRDLVSPYA